MRFLTLLLYFANTLITDRPITQIVWCGASLIFTRDDEVVPQFESINDEKIIFALTESHSVYQSNSTIWQQIEGEFDDIQISPANSKVIYLFGKKSFRSNDCGATFQELNTEGFYNFKLNKMNWRWMIAFKGIDCEQEDMDCRDPYYNQIYSTQDGGLTWIPSFKNVKEASWDKILEDQEVPDQRIIFSFSKESASQVAFSDDFQTYTTLLYSAYGYFQTPQYLFILSPNQEAYQLYYGTSHLDHFQLQELELPIQIYKEYSYTILDSSNGRIIIAVSHSSNDQQYSNIYISNQDGKDFKLVLLQNVRSTDNGNCDFESILGMNQIYIANIYDETNESEKKSVITLDGLKTWNFIHAPLQDSEGTQLQCGGECSLHLVGRTSSYKSAVYSSEYAPGIILSNGNTGIYLSNSTETYNTYISKDAGLNWKEVRKGTSVYDITDFGGLILIANDEEPTNVVHYSTDYGDSWNEKIIYDDLIYVYNVVTEVSNIERYFFVHGKTDRGEGVILKVDFSDLYSRECQEEKDYEYWQESCLDGSQTKYKRKKASARCFNPKNLLTERIVQPCTCTKEDWVCAPGYEREMEGGECLATNAVQFEKCTPGQVFMKSQGYVKVNQCQGGINLGPIETFCAEENDSTGMWLLILAMGSVLMICIVFGWRTIRQLQNQEINCSKKQQQYNQMDFYDEDEEDSEKIL